MKTLTAVVIGFGARGSTYAAYAWDHPEELKIVAVAEKMPVRQETAKKRHGLSDDQIYSDWHDLANQPRMADFAIIATQDNMHFEPAMAMIDKGYNLLLEKPMAPTPEACKAITEAAERKGVKVIVCHVLRFTKFWAAVKNLIDDDAIGNVMSMVHMENVGNEHYSHSYVRGNWRNTKESSCMLIAKSCHDMDLIRWLIGKKCKQVQSFGSLTYFSAANKPEGAPDRCMDGCPAAETCVYNAVKIYCDNKDNWFRIVAAGTVDQPTDEEVEAAIASGPYGRCVFACDNDVVDHQVVNMEFEDGCTATFSMTPFNLGGRFIHIFGTKGELIGNMEDCTIDLFSFDTRKTTHYTTEQIGSSIASGHGGGDTGIMIDLLTYLRGEGRSKSICEVRTSYENHLIGFAAEESRVRNQIINIEDYAEKL